jgi:hypothetical protein
MMEPEIVMTIEVALRSLGVILLCVTNLKAQELTPRQQEAVYLIQELGGSYRFPGQPDVGPITRIDLSGCQTLSFEVLEKLAMLPDVEQLRLGGTNISDADLKAMAGYPKLVGIHLASTNVTDEGLFNLSRLDRLIGLSVSATRVTDKGLAALK